MSEVKFFAEDSAKLAKVIPEHMHSVSFNWCDRSFAVMSPEWRKARQRVKRSGNDACRWCSHAFEDGETMALAQPKKGTNWLLCQTCADKLSS